MKTILCLALLIAPGAFLHGAAPDLRSQHLRIGLSRTTPAFSAFAVDSLGQGKLAQDPVLAETNAVTGLEFDGHTYRLNGKPAWRVEWGEKTVTIRSDRAGGAEALPFTLAFNQKLNHVAGYAQGKFQGIDASGRSLDWRDWKGGGHGYEGLLVDNYHALLAVIENVRAKKP